MVMIPQGILNAVVTIDLESILGKTISSTIETISALMVGGLISIIILRLFKRNKRGSRV